MNVGITRDEYNAIIGEYEATIKALRTRLEEAEKELVYQKERYELQVLGSSTENAALKQKLEEARGWMNSRQADSVVKLRKILDGE